MKTFPIIEEQKDYYLMKPEIFRDMFVEVARLKKTDQETIDSLVKEFNKYRKVKRKRILFKKMNQIFNAMYNEIVR